MMRWKSKVILWISMICLILVVLLCTGKQLYDSKKEMKMVQNSEESEMEIHRENQIEENQIKENQIEEKPNQKTEEEILEEKISEKLESMTLEEKIAQLFIITPEALTDYGCVTQAGEQTKAALNQYPVGGLILFESNVISEEQITEMISKQQEYAKERIGLPLFIAIDEEGGTVTRIAGKGKIEVPEFESMAEIGATNDTAKAYELGNTIGNYLNRMGFNLDLAPVADVLTNSENTVVKSRSFGSDPLLVTAMARQELAGLNANQVYGCLKHFPGHGATAGDTHNGYAYIDKTWDEIKETEIVPFEEMIKSDVSFIMVGHISVPKISGDNIPASCSKKVIQELLRDELGYDGIVLTDALAMKAVTDQYTSAQAAEMVIQAGGDILLMPKDFQSAYQGLLDAVSNNRITEERIDESVRRILRVKFMMES